MHSVTQFHFLAVTLSAESVVGTTPGVRVTWNTTVPPECVASVTVEFRTSRHGPIARNATTRTSLSLETSVTFPLHVLHVLLREPMAVQTLTLVTSLPCP